MSIIDVYPLSSKILVEQNTISKKNGSMNKSYQKIQMVSSKVKRKNTNYLIIGKKIFILNFRIFKET